MRYQSFFAAVVATVCWISSCGALAHHEHYYEDYVSGSYFSLDLPSETKNLYLDGWHYVKELRVKLNREAGSYHGYIEVEVNGVVKATKIRPSYSSRTYTIPIGETADKIRFRNASALGNPSVTVSSVHALVRHEVVIPPSGCYCHHHCTHDCHHCCDHDCDDCEDDDADSEIDFPVKNNLSRLARRATDLIDKLRPYADPETEYIVHLLPIKQKAGWALSIANARGSSSVKTIEAMKVLAAQIASAEEFIDTTFKKEAVFDLGVELLALKDEILDELD